jgi:signal peptidase I
MSAEMQMPESESLAPAPSFVGPVIKPSFPRNLFRQAGQALLLLLLAFISYLLVSHFFLQTVRVVGISMVPTLHDSHEYLLNRWIFYVRAPHRDEIVVLRDPSDNGFSVKRIVAVAGDSVDLKEGEVYINGRPLAEPYLRPGIQTFSRTGQEQVFTCGPNQYFVLGDNRPRSIDSRAYGPVPRRNIFGLIVR